MRAPPSHTLLSTARLAEYNLSRQPFAPPEDGDGLYRNTALDMLANTIVQQLQSGDRIHIIKGERHIGKSTFCLRLEADAPDELNVTRHTATRKTRINDIFVGLIDSVEDIEGTDTHALATAAAQAIFRQLRNHRQPVLLIDDAHYLGTAVLRMVLRFHRSIEKQGLGQLKMVLLTEKEIDRKLAELDNAAPDDARLQTHLLRPLNRAEIGDYVRFRFERAGGRDLPLSARQLEYLQQNAGGLPGKVDATAARLLNGERPPASRRRITIAAAGVAAAAAIIAGIYWMNGDAPPAPTREETANPARDTTTARPDEPPAEADRAAAGADIGTDTEPAETADAAPAGEPTAGPSEAAEPSGGTERESGAQAPVGATGSADTAAPTASPEPAEPDAGPPASDQPARERPARPIDRWPANDYAAQLAGAWSPDSLDALVEQYAGEYDLLVHRVDRNTRDWYILLYGAFADRQSAEAAIDRLPDTLRGDQPWVRPIRGLLTP